MLATSVSFETCAVYSSDSPGRKGTGGCFAGLLAASASTAFVALFLFGGPGAGDASSSETGSGGASFAAETGRGPAVLGELALRQGPLAAAQAITATASQAPISTRRILSFVCLWAGSSRWTR